MNFGDVFVIRFHITHKNFLGDCTNNCMVIASFFFKNGGFSKMLIQKWHCMVPMEIEYICDIYNFWPRKYITASLKYMSNIF